ncbi:MAG: radical SAM family heme chaperone HemW [Planctomycetes bacterium]|uniref:radical SAM family heme chaperone HemW n=1 Tax=Candidatus Wunengus sp. YC65 TaxID=3367701 RepID=UPI001D85CCBD|nr:radical SAM family heme chaperone HemW [Planctomycetota bacterium]
MLHNSLYIHIPFCARKCRYCDFNSIVSESKTVDRYLRAIEKELSSLQDRYVFNTVYIGGGTPSILSEVQLEKLLQSVIRYIPSSEIREYTVEANPGTLTVNKIGLLKEYLVSRISLGVQSFQDRQLQFLGRIHSSNDAKNALDSLRIAGFRNINIDLIFGCSEQSIEDWEKDLKTVVELNPEHISTYALTYEEGTSLTRDLEDAVIHKLDEGVELEMYKTAIRYLTRSGYNHYEISNFAKYGYECAHNHVYWNNMGYVGIGAGAFSFIDGVRTSNEKDIGKYIDGINENKNIKSFRENLQINQFASETVIMSLRLRQGISNVDFYERFGYKIEDQFREQINRLAKDGLISYADERLKLTEKGLFVADTVMTEFI